MTQEFSQPILPLGYSPEMTQEIIRWLTEQRFASEQLALQKLIQAANQKESTAFSEIKDAFSQHLPIGTGGRRGKVGPGPNRFNSVVVRETAQGLADAMRANGDPAKVAVVYDTRRDSRAFAFYAAEQFAANNITAVVIDAPRPTPALSYVVRTLGCGAGVVISASHNPPQDNGIKIYGSDGAQVLGEQADAVLAAILAVAGRPSLPEISHEQRKLIQIIQGQEISRIVDEPYLAYVLAQGTVNHSLHDAGLRVVFTPLHGVGHTSVIPVLRARGVTVLPVEKQCDPDGGRFSTVESANPELPASMHLALIQAKETNADLVLATDPDADRLGACARVGDEFWPIDGNRLGVLMLDHILQTAKLPKNGWVLTTLVTSPLIATLAKAHGVDVVDDLLVGFKHHAGMMRENPQRELVFACEESHGYMRGNDVRDKDGAIAALLLVECAALARIRGQTLFDQLTRIWCTHGYHIEKTENLVVPGLAGRQAIAEVMERWRTQPPTSFGGLAVVSLQDRFKPQTTGSKTRDLPGDVLCFDLGQDAQKCRFVLRPSGTEPKLKLYALARSSGNIFPNQLPSVKVAMDALVDQVLKSAQSAAQEIMAPFLR